MFTIDQIIAYLLGLATKYIGDLIQRLMPIPEDVLFKFDLFRKDLYKKLRNVSIEMTYTLKSSSLKTNMYDWEDFLKKVKEVLIKNNVKYEGQRGNKHYFQFKTGMTEIKLDILPSFFEVKKKGLFLESIQVDFSPVNGKYNQFKDSIVDMLSSTKHLEKTLGSLVGNLTSESLRCGLKKVYRFTGILKGFKLSALTGKIDNKYQIDLSQNGVVVYGSIDSGLISELKKIIAFYY